MSQPTCASCKFFVPDHTVGGQPVPVGNCHRFPPVGLNSFVGVNSGQWCGEYQSRPAPAAIPPMNLDGQEVGCVPVLKSAPVEVSASSRKPRRPT